jgi:glycosyltransferase involved in cell wall biosynthesis
VSVTIVVPVRNEEATIEALLLSLVAQSQRADEIVIADGGSNDATVAISQKYAEKGIRVLEVGPAYPGKGRNAGILAARNEWIALIDAGCVADRAWLEKLLAARKLLNAPVGVVLGEYAPLLRDEWDIAQALAFVAPLDPRTGMRPAFIGASLVHRRAWERAGRFPEQLRAAEDLVFFENLRLARIPFVRAPGAVVHWRLSSGPGGVFRRFRLYSAHHLAAGLFRTWHLRVMAMDGAGLALVAICVLWPPVFAVLVAAVLGRLLRTVARRRKNVQSGSFRLDRLLRVSLLLLLADAALWLGAFDYVTGREARR